MIKNSSATPVSTFPQGLSSNVLYLLQSHCMIRKVSNSRNSSLNYGLFKTKVYISIENVTRKIITSLLMTKSILQVSYRICTQKL